MTSEEKRIAIAEACGWTDCQYDWYPWDSEGREGKGCFGIAPINRHLPKATSFWRIPHYPSSLDAMHEAEKTLSEDEFERYGRTLVRAAMEKGKTDTERGRLTLSATAAQRADAFLKVKGLFTAPNQEGK